MFLGKSKSIAVDYVLDIKWWIQPPLTLLIISYYRSHTQDRWWLYAIAIRLIGPEPRKSATHYNRQLSILLAYQDDDARIAMSRRMKWIVNERSAHAHGCRLRTGISTFSICFVATESFFTRINEFLFALIEFLILTATSDVNTQSDSSTPVTGHTEE